MLALIRKDVLLWVRVPQSLLVTILVPVVLMAVAILANTVQQRLSLAVVDPSQMVAAIASNSPYIHVIPVEYEQAESWLQDGDIIALLTVSPDFSKTPLATETWQNPIEMRIRNRDEDLTRNYVLRLYDIVLGVNQKLTTAAGEVEPVHVREHGLLPDTISDALYLATGILVFTAIYGGLANTALLLAREWDESAIKEVLLAPRHRLEIILAKIFTGWLETMVSLLVVLLFSYWALGLQPVGNPWLLAFFLVITALLGAAVGALFGCVIRRIIPAVMLSIVLATFLWFVGGGFGPVPFTSNLVQQIAWKSPTTYAIAALQQVMHTTFTVNLAHDAAIVGISTAVLLVVSLATCQWTLTRSPLGQGQA